MTRCPACHQTVRTSKPPTVNYTLFSSRFAGMEMTWMIAAGERWKNKPYMEKYKMFPHQIGGGE